VRFRAPLHLYQRKSGIVFAIDGHGRAMGGVFLSFMTRCLAALDL
jgi:hypothetical protein